MIESSGLRIGLFDSGVGGLTVLREIYRQMPQESILYFADTARLPYGNRSPEEILQFVRDILDWMSTQGVKMIIMACNTSSALALEIVREEYNIPILGLILPGARAAVQQGKNIGVIATLATAASNAYRQAIQEIDQTAQVWQVGCPEFVPLIEQNRIYSSYTRQVAQRYLQPLLHKQIDTLVYGCTHYRHLDGIIRSIIPSTINIVDPAEHIVIAAEKELALMGLKNNQLPLPTHFCVSGSPKQFAHLSRQWLGYYPKVDKVYLKESSLSPMTLKPLE
ncbi:glutamate racemase [Stanieria cyanosphaera PCC 7437]|uniref:Glutamate racemase n=1 Tax=Stanieria cyanosphaera (strain ATCC 29371 / PCC 7437) TaxID=111780 RepID=K9XNX8_STAC7|nr:glutamate racemase [Stanieria cyanosphaera]AFZ34228.1 glutamate racemase [Stanieria cyanosphaera PCC 7437]